MSRSLKKSLQVLSVLFLFTVAAFLVLGERFLRLESDQENIRTDAVITLAGSTLEDRLRIETAVDLFHRKKAAYLILPMRNRYFTWDWAVKTYNLDVTPPQDRILIGRFGTAKQAALDRYGSTFVEAQYAAQLMQHHRLRSAVVVSSGYHMRRVALAFDRTGKAAGLTYSYHPVGWPDWTWWIHKNRFRKILDEYKKLMAAIFLYPSG